MRVARCRTLLVLFAAVLLFPSHSEALQCYTCMGSNNLDCNRQGTRECPSHSDACAVVVGHGSGVMKSCSYRSFCSQANSQSYRAPGARVHCCYSDNCNVSNSATRLPKVGGLWLLLPPLLLGWACA